MKRLRFQTSDAKARDNKKITRRLFLTNEQISRPEQPARNSGVQVPPGRCCSIVRCPADNFYPPMKTYLELIRDREAEIEAAITEPRYGTVTTSCDFLRALISEYRALGKEVEHDASGVYFFGDLAIKADGTMPKGCFMIELT